MVGTDPVRHGRGADPVLAVLAAAALACLVAVLAARPPVAITVAAAAKPVLRVAFVVLCWQVAARPQIAPAARRFWRTLAAAGVFLAAGNLVGLVTGAETRGDPAGMLAMSLVLLPGILLGGWALLAYPLQVPPSERTRLRLDVATVMCAFLVAAWYMWLPAGSSPDNPAQLALTALGCAVMLVVAYAAVKLLLSGSAPFTPPAGVLLGAGLLVGAWYLFNLLRMRIADVQLLQAGQLTSAFLLPIAARVQYLQMRTRPSGLTTRSRPRYSRLPYLAVAATQLLLVLELWTDGLTLRAWGMVAGTATVTALVIARQNLAFADNARLVDRLDASILQLRQHERRFRSLVQHASDITLLVDATGTVRYASPSLSALLGTPPEQATGTPLADVLQPAEAADVAQLLADARDEPDTSVRHRLQVHDTRGRQRWLEAVATNRLDDSSVSGIVINVRDVTETRLLEQQLRHEATHDHLTGLPNRALLEDRAHRLLAGNDQTPGLRAVLLLDLDDFKTVNDQLGHHAGDRLLVAVAERLRGSVRPTDTVARLGGDEFVVLLAGTTASGAVDTARRIHAALAQPLTIDGHPLAPRVSIGVAFGTREPLDTLLRNADAAMYQAKRQHADIRVHGDDSTGTPAQAGDNQL
ncbi:sensor domain-containing diguanylate cyclase [Catellatospora tritici]|uniref:sensor domain-containing diguanylate cyclase n=1 Tax=Catellatospora tritici TaxID=2851566 RepID=UPI001C2D25E5|nr:sensor domain-containing diguanylate cyclase [Catellatospora tritici]MBV1856632.1 sensor domain-containing diguanylate cyclase [Catellatospora tritici]